MQSLDGLNFPLTSLANGFTLTNTQLENIIEILPEHQSTTQNHSLLKLLHLAEKTLTTQEEPSLSNLLGEVLKALTEKVKIKQPIKWLALGDFEEYHEFCLENEDKELKRAYQWSLGIFPVTYKNHPCHSSIYLQKTTNIASGNPQWLQSRKALKDYYQIKGAKMNQQIKQFYLFLLSDHTLLQQWKEDPLMLLWTELYLLYNHLVLSQNLQETYTDVNQSLITWYKPTLEDTLSRIKQLESNLPLEERLLYFLVLGILGSEREVRDRIGYPPFQAAFQTFLKVYNETSQWHNLMALLLFNQISKKGGISSIKEESYRKYKSLIDDRFSFDKAIPFLYFFMQQEEIISVVATNNLEYWKLPFPQTLKQTISKILLSKGILHLKSLKYINRQFFAQNVFKSPSLEDPNLGNKLILTLEENQDEFLKFLKGLWRVGQEEGQRNYRLFIQIWKNCYQFLGEGDTQLARIALLTHSEFHPTLQSTFLLPSDTQSTSFSISMKLIRGYRTKYSTNDDAQTLNKKISSFQKQILPNLLSLWNEEQITSFWIEWGELTKMNPQLMENNV